MKTIKGNLLFGQGFNVFHVWGRMPNGEVISEYFATKNVVKLLKNYPQPNIYVDVASYDLETEYNIFE